jgi:large subunit ribosomal protein L4e
MPSVMTVPIRNDLVHYVHSNLAKNRRQGHAVFHKAGAEHSAESWGTGRAVARIPRISGSGTSRSGQATFGNMARKARMFAPLKIWRKIHAKCNINQRRHAVASALAASACTPLVMARGHSVENVTEFPMVVDGLNQEKTNDLLQVLEKLGVADDLKKVRSSKKIRTGVGKYRNSRYVMRKGPLLVYGDNDDNVAQAARNIAGVDVCNVHRLNILQLPLEVTSVDSLSTLNPPSLLSTPSLAISSTPLPRRRDTLSTELLWSALISLESSTPIKFKPFSVT